MCHLLFCFRKFMGTREYISTLRLQPGMIIDQSITDATGRVMIKRNVYLDQYQIEYLMSRGISGVYITDTLEEDGKPGIESAKKKIIIPSASKKVIARERVDDPTKVEMSETVKARVNEGIQYLFKNTNADNFSGAAMQVSKDLTEAIMTNSAVAIDINTLKVSDEYTFKHSVDVAMISMIIGKRHGLSRDEIREIGVAGLLHDMGKSKIPTEILNKPGKLTDEEFALMKRHPYDGYQILKDRGGFSNAVLAGVLQHHEKINAGGYPMGLSKDQIHLFGRLIAVADIFDALVTKRPYKDAFPMREAVEMIMSMTGELDISCINSFLGSVICYPVDSVVELSNGQLCKVVANVPMYPLRPRVVAIETGEVYDLANDLKCANLIIM